MYTNFELDKYKIINANEVDMSRNNVQKAKKENILGWHSPKFHPIGELKEIWIQNFQKSFHKLDNNNFL